MITPHIIRMILSTIDRQHGAVASLFLRENGTHPTRSCFDSIFCPLVDHSFGGHLARAGDAATYYADLGLSQDINILFKPSGGGPQQLGNFIFVIVLPFELDYSSSLSGFAILILDYNSSTFS